VKKMACKDQKIHYKEKMEEHLLLNKHELDVTKRSWLNYKEGFLRLKQLLKEDH